MATEKQYEFFKMVFSEERDRYRELAERAKLYQGVITLYLTAIILKSDDLIKFVERFKISVLLFLGTACMLLVAFALTMGATRIREYERLAELREVTKEFGAVPPTDETFLRNRLADFTIATERNYIQNERVAGLLSLSAWLIFGAILLQLVGAGWAVVNEVKGSRNEKTGAVTNKQGTRESPESRPAK